MGWGSNDRDCLPEGLRGRGKKSGKANERVVVIGEGVVVGGVKKHWFLRGFPSQDAKTNIIAYNPVLLDRGGWVGGSVVSRKSRKMAVLFILVPGPGFCETMFPRCLNYVITRW